MKRSLLPVLLLPLSALLAGQNNTYYSLGGFGNVVYPGTGHAPNAAFLSAPHGNGGYGGKAGGFGGGFNHNGGHPRTVIVPYPLFYGNYYDPSAAAPAQQQDPGNQAPSVVINQTFVPDRPAPAVQEVPDPGAGMKLYPGPIGPYQQQPELAPPARPRVTTPATSDEPTVYLLAFKDHTIVQALGYWMEGGVLHYVSAEHSLNQASLDLIDRALSQRLNDERGVEFKLPAR